MTPFLVATLLALLLVGGLVHLHRRGDALLFRRTLAGAAVAVLLVAAYAVWIAGGELARVDPDQVALGELQLVEAAGSFRLEGRAGNRSATHTLLSLPLRLVVEDCAADGNCRTVLDAEREAMLTIPPGGSVGFRLVYVATAAAVDAGRAGGDQRRWRVEPGSPRASGP